MEFTQIVKKGSACLFLVLLAHGLYFGFSIPTTVLSVVLVGVVCLFEAQLVKSERLEYEKKVALMTTNFEQQVFKVSEQAKADNAQLKEMIDTTRSQISAIKVNQGMRKM